MDILRTPDDRFDDLGDWPFEPRYAEVIDEAGPPLRLHYIDEGPADAPPVLLMHGEPTWAYLYRKIIPELAARGWRVLAPDLIGFGRSDKPADRDRYSYERHVGWIAQWLSELDLTDVTLFCQDWGGLIGLRLVAAFPDRFAAVIAANTGLPTGEGATLGFANWLAFSQSVSALPISTIVDGGTLRSLTESERRAYDAPFPDERFKAGARQFPVLVPISPIHPSVEQNKSAWEVLERFDKPFVTAFSDGDPVTRGGDSAFRNRVAGAAGERHETLPGGHFLQEDCPEAIVELIDTLARRVRRR